MKVDRNIPPEWFWAADGARNAALRADSNDQMGALYDAIAAVAPLIRAAEMERCARVAQNNAEHYKRLNIEKSDFRSGYEYAGDEIAAAIRAMPDDA